MSSRRSPLVTVLMPVYNAAGYVADAVRSILAEPVENLELLVVDDGSTDDSAAELAALEDDRIRVVSQPNSGLVAALNAGLDAARGTYLARMDADDLSVPGRIAAQLRWLQERPSAVACGTDYETFGAVTGRVRLPRTDRGCRERLLLGSCHCGASVVLRRTVVETAGLRFDPDFPHAEDYEFFTRLAAYGELGNVPMVGYRYRMHDDQVSSRHVDVQRSVHLRVAARYAARTGMPPLSDDVVRKIMWPETDGVARATLVTGGAAVRAFRRRPGVETARFTGRRVVEAALSAAKS
ncbi:glycosyltransferase family A protein [Gordonia sp. LSe1-13]|uniref:Glycosyltransferase family A protein n=1 Tax=Gordonia sesuvii TaxID=3116777 RepID=A0ABU7MBC2_9ACTN|nr:glycosyltransferase family A protein [Gordonia sp. LSe1-13]